jgi:putative DNA primase/helicase
VASITSPRLQDTLTSDNGLLAIDEVTQVIDFLTKDICHTQGSTSDKTHAKLVDMIKRAETVIAVDAHISAETVAFFKAIRSDVTVYEVEARPENPPKVKLIAGKEGFAQLVGWIALELAGGGNVWLGCESKKKAVAIEKALLAHGAISKKGYIRIDADNAKAKPQKAFLADADAESLNYRLVIHSPTITSGISVEHKDNPHFTLTAFIGGGDAITPLAACQMLRRVRYVKRILVCITQAHGTSGKRMEAEAVERGAKMLGFNPSQYDGLVARTAEKETALKADFATVLFYALKYGEGFNVLHADTATLENEYSATLKAVTKEAKQARITAITTSAILTEAEAQAIEAQAGALEQDEIWKLEAHRIRNEWKIEEITESTLATIDKYGVATADRLAAVMGWDTSDDLETGHFSTSSHRMRIRGAWQWLGWDGDDFSSSHWITEEAASAALAQIEGSRLPLFALGLLPAKYSSCRSEEVGDETRLLEIKHSYPIRDLLAIFERCGIASESKQLKIGNTSAHMYKEKGGDLFPNRTENEQLEKRQRVYKPVIDNDLLWLAMSRHRVTLNPNATAGKKLIKPHIIKLFNRAEWELHISGEVYGWDHWEKDTHKKFKTYLKKF